jgi:hypothetical protein
LRNANKEKYAVEYIFDYGLEWGKWPLYVIRVETLEEAQEWLEKIKKNSGNETCRIVELE